MKIKPESADFNKYNRTFPWKWQKEVYDFYRIGSKIANSEASQLVQLTHGEFFMLDFEKFKPESDSIEKYNMGLSFFIEGISSPVDEKGIQAEIYLSETPVEAHHIMCNLRADLGNSQECISQ